MKNDPVVIINGQAYDSNTGRPVPVPEPNASQKQRRNFHDIKSVSKIIRPRSQKTPENLNKKTVMPLNSGRRMDITKNKSVVRFAKHKETIKGQPQNNVNADTPPVKHPLAHQARQAIARHKQSLIKPVSRTPQQIKNDAINEALNRPQIAQQTTRRKKRISHKVKVVLVFATCLITLLGAGYLIYLYTPNISVQFANAQAGINAKLPEYTPNGYGVDGPATHNGKQVTINFKSNAGNTKYAIAQSKSSWDSSALKNWVEDESDGKFKTTSINGLTIFSYDCCAAWVNGGILYKVSGDARLLLSEIQKIATSL